DKQGGTEPDESYCIETDKEFPDLAIEVVVTSGSINKLAVYKKLSVKEVWFWQNNQFYIHHLRGDEYKEILISELLPNLNLTLLSQYVTRSDTLEAILEFRNQIRQSLIKSTND
ncbi:MAG: Uma2 family endonuclease, partial [Hydrococcus sp. RM1_1_31]|nr:Uma2 family endonuclease [Hydrococcus sp. RM1_1_31]